LEEFYYTSCLDVGAQYKFSIYDEYGDGACCDWGPDRFTLQYGNVIVVEDGGCFEELDTYLFTIPEVKPGECTASDFRLPWKS
jgi:hypothetical protein